MSPGYDRPDHSDFSREVSDSCQFCHNGYPSQSNSGLAQGIDCQRCHGPGKAHAENPRSPITNPAKLDRDKQLEVCLQCHLESTSRTLPDAIRRFDRTVFSYRPGEPLSNYLIYFEFISPPSDERMTVNGAGYGLLKSKCFLKSAGRLGCTTCHDPHRTVGASQTESHYRLACRSCHAGEHEPSTRDCVGCHMQKRRTEDAVHVVMTDHRIHKLPLRGNPLAPMAERRDRFSGPVKLLYPLQLPDTSESRIYLALGKGDAKGLRSALLEEPSRFAEPYLRMGEMLRKAGLQQEALAEVRRAMELSPADPRAYVSAAEIMLGRNEIDAVIPIVERGLTLVPDRHPLLNSLAILYVAKGRFDDGLRVLNEAIRLRPDDAATWVNLGVCLEAKKDLRGAIAAYAQALTINPALARASAHFHRLTKSGN
jgi:predicted CXXCH cytochrome family protein